MHIRIFNYNTLERVHQFEAHSDYLRSIAVHPTQPYLLTSSDDMMIKLWDWDNKWANKQVFEGMFSFIQLDYYIFVGHTHYVMQLVINPKDNNTFATASLDRTVKVWQFGSTQPNFTLEGHEKGVCLLLLRLNNCHSYRWIVSTTIISATSLISYRAPMIDSSKYGTIKIRHVSRHSMDMHRMYRLFAFIRNYRSFLPVPKIQLYVFGIRAHIGNSIDCMCVCNTFVDLKPRWITVSNVYGVLRHYAVRIR